MVEPCGSPRGRSQTRVPAARGPHAACRGHFSLQLRSLSGGGNAEHAGAHGVSHHHHVPGRVSHAPATWPLQPEGLHVDGSGAVAFFPQNSVLRRDLQPPRSQPRWARAPECGSSPRALGRAGVCTQGKCFPLGGGSSEASTRRTWMAHVDGALGKTSSSPHDGHRRVPLVCSARAVKCQRPSATVATGGGEGGEQAAAARKGPVW